MSNGQAIRRTRLTASSLFQGIATLIIIVNLMLYAVIWFLAWRNGSIPGTEDFFGNHGPWRRECFLNWMFPNQDLFCFFTRGILPLMILSALPGLMASALGFILKPGWGGAFLILFSVVMGFIAVEHVILID